MSKNYIFIFFSILILPILFVILGNYSPVSAGFDEFLLSKRLGGVGADNVRGITVDNQNNIIITGYLTGDLDLNGDGDKLDGGESSVGYGSADIFVSSFDSQGNYLWSNRMGGAGSDVGQSVKADGQNRVIVAGYVTGDANFNSDGDKLDGGESSVGYGGTDSFVVAFDSQGSFLWSKRLGGTGGDLVNGITTDDQNHIIVTGYVNGDVDLSGDGDKLDGGESSVGYGSADSYISVFENDGSYIWSKRMGGAGNDLGNNITTDAQNRVIVTGQVIGDADFSSDGDKLDEGESSVGYGGNDIFIAVLDADGNYILSKRFGGAGVDAGKGIFTDSQNRIILTGQVTGDSDLNGDGDYVDGNGESSVGYGNSDIFISALDSQGGYIWSKRMGGLGVDSGNRIITDAQNRITIIGNVTGDADLNGDGDFSDGNGESSVGYGNTDFFILTCDSGGGYLWSKRLGGAGLDGGSDVAIDSQDNIILAGIVTGDADLNGDGDFSDGNGESSVGYSGSDIFISIFNTDYSTPTSFGTCSSGCPDSPDYMVSAPKPSSILERSNVITMFNFGTFKYNALLSITENLKSGSFRLAGTNYWQTGPIQEVWWKSWDNGAKIYPSEILKPFTLIFKYSPSSLEKSISEKTLKLAFSSDGKKWKIINSKLDTKNDGLVIVTKQGGYYMIVGRGASVEPQITSVQGVSTQNTKNEKTIQTSQPQIVSTPLSSNISKPKKCFLWWCW